MLFLVLFLRSKMLKLSQRSPKIKVPTAICESLASLSDTINEFAGSCRLFLVLFFAVKNGEITAALFNLPVDKHISFMVRSNFHNFVVVFEVVSSVLFCFVFPFSLFFLFRVQK